MVSPSIALQRDRKLLNIDEWRSRLSVSIQIISVRVVYASIIVVTVVFAELISAAVEATVVRRLLSGIVTNSANLANGAFSRDAGGHCEHCKY